MKTLVLNIFSLYVLSALLTLNENPYTATSFFRHSMDFTEPWKSLWPISSVHAAPLLLHSSPSNQDPPPQPSKNLGPLIFTPSPNSLTQLHTSPSLSPHLPPPFPNLPIQKFIQTSASSLLPSTALRIATSFGPQVDTADSFLTHNRLQLLRCPGIHSVIAFFPTGDNSDVIGFVTLSVENSSLVVKLDERGDIITAKNKLLFRIRQLLVNPVGDFCDLDNSCFSCVGYLFATTLYGIYWYGVRIKGGEGEGSVRPSLEFLGSKVFKSCGIVNACWSPHLLEESLVLLENGELFLFDVKCRSSHWRLEPTYSGKRVRVLWDGYNVCEGGEWVGCEFSWHPRIVIVAHSSAVFLIDLRSDRCSVSCLLRVDMLGNGGSVNNDRFIVFSRAGSDGFYFTVASNSLLLLCDVRKPLMPVLQWSHSLVNPNYVRVFRLSDLRSNSRDDEHKWASEAGYGILMGSFRSCEFGLFCFGPDNRIAAASQISRFSISFYAWELPSDLLLPACDCHCGSCLVNEEFWKGALLDWTDWRQKKEIILGFGILDKDLFSQLSPPDGLGGFTLIRLTSCGKLESQSYCASWETVNASERIHNCFEDTHLYRRGEAEYNFPKRYQYLEFNWLNGYLESRLHEILVSEMKEIRADLVKKLSFGSDFHENICKNLKACGISRLQGSSEVHDAFKDISLPTSIHEIALTSLWSHLPLSLLRLSFSTYSEILEVPMKKYMAPFEFLEVPNKPHLPPYFFRKPSSHTNKWLNKSLPGFALVGPAVPLPFLVTLSKLDAVETEKQSADLELKHHCDKVMQVANEVSMSSCSDHIVSLADDGEDTCYSSQIATQFSMHKPAAFSKSISNGDSTLDNSFYEDEKHRTAVYRARQNDLFSSARSEMDGSELFDWGCPIELKFDGSPLNISSKEMKTYKLFKTQYSNFKKGFNMYQEYLAKSNVQK